MMLEDSEQVSVLERSEILQRLEKAIDVARCDMQKRAYFRERSHARFVEHYLENRCWLACELEVRCGCFNGFALLACFNPDATIRERGAADLPTRLYASKVVDGDEQPVLIDVAQFVDGPKIATGPAFVSLNLIEDGDKVRGQEKGSGPNLAFEPFFIVGEGKRHFRRIAAKWLNHSPHEIIKGASQVPDCVADDRAKILALIMEGLKINAQISAFVTLDRDFVKLRSGEILDGTFHIKNVFACPFEFEPSIQ